MIHRNDPEAVKYLESEGFDAAYPTRHENLHLQPIIKMKSDDDDCCEYDWSDRQSRVVRCRFGAGSIDHILSQGVPSEDELEYWVKFGDLPRRTEAVRTYLFNNAENFYGLGENTLIRWEDVK